MPLDVIVEGRQPARWKAGGTAANVAAILGVLGWRAALAGRIGDDVAGRFLLSDLAQAGVDSGLIRVDRGAETTRLIHEIDEGGHCYGYKCPDCQRRLPRSRPLLLEQVDEILSASPSPDVFFFDRVNPATVELAESYSAAGTLVVFEPATPANVDLVARAMSVASIVKGSDEPGSDYVVTAPTGPNERLRVVTRGSAGAQFRLGKGKWHSVGVFDISAVDTGGAGDWTTAGLLHDLAGSGSLTVAQVKEAILFGHSLAALNCTLPGARGLAEMRKRSSILALATRMRNGAQAVPARRAVKAQVAPANACECCLLQKTSPSATASTATAG